MWIVSFIRWDCKHCTGFYRALVLFFSTVLGGCVRFIGKGRVWVEFVISLVKKMVTNSSFSGEARDEGVWVNEYHMDVLRD